MVQYDIWRGPYMSGTRNDYLGTDLDYSEAGKVKISMVNLLKKAINEFPK